MTPYQARRKFLGTYLDRIVGKSFCDRTVFNNALKRLMKRKANIIVIQRESSENLQTS